MFLYLLDEVPGIDGEIRGQVEFTFQDLIDGLLPVFGCEWRLEEKKKRVRTGGCNLSTGIQSHHSLEKEKLLIHHFTVIWAERWEITVV